MLQHNFKTIDKSLNKLKQEIDSDILRASQNKEDIFTIRHLKLIDKDNYVKYMDSLIQSLKNTLLKLTMEDEHKEKMLFTKLMRGCHLLNNLDYCNLFNSSLIY